VLEFLAKNKMADVPHPLYLPDFTPSDFFFFPKMKIKLKGQRFDTTEEIQVEMQMVLNTLTMKDNKKHIIPSQTLMAFTLAST
jgi:hypothetical protein